MPVSPLAESWMLGVAANPVAPSSVLLRLLGDEGRPAWRTLCRERALPGEVIEAILAHPERAVRAGFARNRYVDPELRGRLAKDRDPLVRWALAGGPHPHTARPKPLPDAAIVHLLTAHNPDDQTVAVTADEIRDELAGSGQVPHSFRRAALTHPQPLIRGFAVGIWLFLTPEQRTPLLADPAPEVQEALRWHQRLLDPETAAEQLPDKDCHYRSLILANYAISHAVAERCFAQRRDLRSLAGNPHTPYAFVQRLAREADPAIRARVATRCDLDPDLYAQLAKDPDPMVRTRILVHEPPRTEPQRQMIDYFIGRSADDIGTIHEWFNPPTPDWFVSCATSVHPLLRRIAATFPRLPANLAERLAQDPDDDVRHLLAYNHPLAPPDLLLDAFIASRRQRPYLLGHPRLPRTGLADLLDHQDPEVRVLATADTTLPQPPVAQLKDHDTRVRAAAAANPLLPADLLTELLHNPEHAQAAASSPALPVERLHELLDRAGIPRSANARPSRFTSSP